MEPITSHTRVMDKGLQVCVFVQVKVFDLFVHN